MELLGHTIKDEVTGFVGIANQYVEKYGSCPMYSIQPEGDGKSMPEGYSFDVDRCVLITDGRTIKVADRDSPVLVELGDQVEDLVTGQVGIVMEVVTFLNGCVFVSAYKKKDADKLLDDGKFFVMHSRVKILAKGYLQRQEELASRPTPPQNTQPATNPPPQRRTGGPSHRSYRP